MIAAAMTTLPLHRFAPVGLDELVAEAALLTRADRKYVVSLDDAAAVLDELDDATRALDIDGRREFSYDTVYFDTPGHLAYRLTAQRRRHRFKLRTRSYLDTGGAYLELKTKSGRGHTVKERIGCDPADRARLTRAGAGFVAERLAQHGHDPALVEVLRPSLRNEYRRVTLLLPAGIRATVDTELRWSRPDGGELHWPAHAIVETKSPGPAGPLDRALWRRGHRPSRVSKFGVATAALHPDLPHNKWARLLRGQLSAEGPATEGTS